MDRRKDRQTDEQTEIEDTHWHGQMDRQLVKVANRQTGRHKQTNKHTAGWTERDGQTAVAIGVDTNYQGLISSDVPNHPNIYTTQTSSEILLQVRKKLRLDFLWGIFPWRYSWNWVMWYPCHSTALRFKLLLFFVFFLLLFLLIYFSGTWRVWEGKAVWEIFTLSMWYERIYLESLRSLAFLSIKLPLPLL